MPGAGAEGLRGSEELLVGVGSQQPGSLSPAGPAGLPTTAQPVPNPSLPARSFQSQPLDCLKRTQTVSLRSLFFPPAPGGGPDLVQEFPWRAETSIGTPLPAPPGDVPARRGSPPAPFAPVPTSVSPLASHDTTPATIPPGPLSLSKRRSRHSPSLGLPSPDFGGQPHASPLPWLPAPHLQAGSGTNRPVWFGTSCSPPPPWHIFFPPFRAAAKAEALLVPNSGVHLPKPRHRQWGHLPLSCP